MHYRKLTLALSAALLTCGCAPTLSPAASGVVTVWAEDSGEIVQGCKRMTAVLGKSSTVFGGVVGGPQAEASVREQAAALGADTVVLTHFSDGMKGSRLTGVAYRCND